MSERRGQTPDFTAGGGPARAHGAGPGASSGANSGAGYGAGTGGPLPDSMLDLVPVLEAAHRRGVRHQSRLLLYSLSLTLLLLTVWAAFADLEEVVSGAGQIIPSQRIQHIQNLEGGILREIKVEEGDLVESGDLLVRIENTEAGSIHRDSLTRSLELEAAMARLEAELSGKKPTYPKEIQAKAPEMIQRHNQLLESRRARTANERNALTAQLDLKKMEEQELAARAASLRQSLGLATRQRDMAKKLMETRSYSEMEYLGLEQQVAQLSGDIRVIERSIPKTRAAIREAQEKLRLHQSEVETSIIQELNATTAELATLREVLVTSKDRVTRTEVRSPVRGIIKSINVTTAGGVIMPGQVIMDVVPADDTLVVEARIRPQDIAFLFVGQKARIRLSAYDFSIYGAMDAVLEHISADTIEGRQGEIFYLARLRTTESTMRHNGRDLPIMPGMMATADIITGKRTVLDYILKPILKAKQEALREH